MLRAALLASVGVGVAVSVQSRVNAVLAMRLIESGESATTAGFHSALISFVTGLVLLAAAVVAVPRMRGALRSVAGSVRDGRLRRWQLLGGIAGAWLVATQGLTVPTLGVALFIVAVVAGQAFGSLGVDAIGLGPAGRLQLTANRIIGALLALCAVVVAVAPRLGDAGATGAPLLGALALSAGLGIAVQQALNAQVSVASGWAPAAAVVNFIVGTALLLVVVLAGRLLAGWSLAPLPDEPWLYIGGPLGVAFIALAARVVPILGVLRFALASIAGQLAGGAALDLLFPQPGVMFGWGMALGVGLTLAAVAIANRQPALRP